MPRKRTKVFKLEKSARVTDKIAKVCRPKPQPVRPVRCCLRCNRSFRPKGPKRICPTCAPQLDEGTYSVPHSTPGLTSRDHDTMVD